jgi:hypothetical protein
MFGPLIGQGIWQAKSKDAAVWPTPMLRATASHMRRLMARVPPDAHVSASFGFLASLANREKLYTFHYVFRGRYSISTKPFVPPKDCDYALVNMMDPVLAGTITPVSGRLCREFFEMNGLAPVESAGDVVLLQRDAKEPIELWKVGDDAVRNPYRVVYEGQLILHGRELAAGAFRPGDLVPLRMWWSRTGPANRLKFYIENFVLVGEDGTFVLGPMRYIGYNLFPVHDWPGDTPVREDYRMILPEGMKPGNYVLGMMMTCETPQGMQYCRADVEGVRKEAFTVRFGTLRIEAR